MTQEAPKISDIDDIGPNTKYAFEEETYAIIGAAMDVYYKLGNGFAEPVYQEALEIEFGLRKVPFEAQRALRIEYKGYKLKKTYVVDFLCFDQIIVEIKALNRLSPTEWSQIMNYLKVSKLRIGLLFNFGSQSRLEVKRLAI